MAITTYKRSIRNRSGNLKYPLSGLGKVKNLSELPKYELKDKYWIDVAGIVYVEVPPPPEDKNKKYVRPMSPDTKNGYLEYTLQNKYNKKVHVQAHRLCALAFVNNPNPDKLTEVNHKDGVRDNPHMSNLEWVDHSQNIQHSWDNLRTRK